MPVRSLCVFSAVCLFLGLSSVDGASLGPSDLTSRACSNVGGLCGIAFDVRMLLFLYVDPMNFRSARAARR